VGPRRLPPLRAFAVAAAAGGLAYALYRALLRYRPPSPRHEATRLLEGVERVLRSARVGPDGDEGIEELTLRLRAQGHPLSPPLEAATRRYLEARFGQRQLSPGERQALVSALRRAVRQHRAAA
jgi:protein-glutamine gamma-glutamyltransferase